MILNKLMLGILVTNQLYARSLPEIVIPEPVIEIESEPIVEEVVYEQYRQTVFTVIEDTERQLGSGHRYGDSNIRNIDNVMHYNDAEYGWLPIIAVDIDEVYASGLNERGTPNIYGSVVELTYQDDIKTNAIILDACGACTNHDRIDLWTYKLDYELDVDDVKLKRIRQGYVQK